MSKPVGIEKKYFTNFAIFCFGMWVIEMIRKGYLQGNFSNYRVHIWLLFGIGVYLFTNFYFKKKK